MKFKIIDIENKSTEKFIMHPVELKDYIDFEVKRIYFISEAKQATGEHCHYREKEFFLLLSGSCTAVIDSGKGKEEISMSGGETALYVPNYVWHGFKDFSSDAILLALSSTNYNPDRSDYLEDYQQYLTIRDKNIKEV